MESQNLAKKPLGDSLDFIFKVYYNQKKNLKGARMDGLLLRERFAAEMAAVFNLNQELKGAEKLRIFETDQFKVILAAIRSVDRHAPKLTVLKFILKEYSDMLRHV